MKHSTIVHALKTDLRESEARFRDQVEKLRNLEAICAQLKLDVSDSSHKIESLTKDCSSLQKELQSSIERRQTVDSELLSSREYIASQKTEIHTLKENLSSLLRENQSSESLRALLSNKEDETKKTYDLVSSLQEQLRQHVHQHELDAKDIIYLRDNLKRIEELLATTKSDLDISVDKIKLFEAEGTAFRAECSKLKDENAKLHEDLATKTQLEVKYKSESEMLSRDLATVGDDLTRIRVSNDESQKSLSERDAALRFANDVIEKLKCDLENSRLQLKEADDFRAVCEQYKEMKEKECSDLDSEVQRLRSEISKANSDIRAIEHYHGDFLSLEARFHDLSENFTASEDLNAALKDSLHQNRKEIDSLLAKNKALENGIKALGNVDHENSELMESYVICCENVKQLERKLLEFESESESGKVIEALKCRISELESETDILRQAVSDFLEPKKSRSY
jgi:chromosome segregation ATPase